MRKLALILLIAPLVSLAQDIPNLNPTLGWLVEKSLAGEIEQLEHVEMCEAFWKNKSGFLSREELPEDEKKLFDTCAIDLAEYWSVNGIGCSWYCGGGQDSQSATSELKSTTTINYKASNAHDLSYKTAWIEGVPGYGIGEKLVYHVQPTNPRITEIIVVNGYVKSDKSWNENSRVKTLKMYVDGRPFAILNLANTKAEQHFKIEPLGNGQRDNWGAIKEMPIWTMTFEIIEVYEGDKFDDTAITEIYFDGIDVH